MSESTSINSNIIKYKNEELIESEDQIVTEFPLTVFLNNEEFATMVCSPTHLEELVIGFLASEGVIRFRQDLKSIEIDVNKGFAYVLINSDIAFNQQQYSKRFIGSCCGKSRQFYFVNDTKTAKTATTRVTISAKDCIQLMNQMQESSTTFRNTGGVHNAALCSQSEMIVCRTDIGRHNALDKILGYCVNHKIPTRDKIIVFSGRISSEVLLKAAKIGVGIVLSKSAPTDLAIKIADDLNMTAVGFVRGNSLNVYSHPERISK